MTTPNGLLVVRPVLFCAPVFWIPEYWSTHAFDWVRAETPLDEKPWAELEVSLDVRLGEVLLAAADAWGLAPGPDFNGGSLEGQFYRIHFVDEQADAQGVDEKVGYTWGPYVNVARENGTVEQAWARDLSYRELLASSQLGLISGDVTRPYVYPNIPQGSISDLVEAGRLTLQAIHAAYAGVDDTIGFAEHTIRLIRASLPRGDAIADKTIDEGVRLYAVYGAYKALRASLARASKRLKDRSGRDHERHSEPRQ